MKENYERFNYRDNIMPEVVIRHPVKRRKICSLKLDFCLRRNDLQVKPVRTWMDRHDKMLSKIRPFLYRTRAK